MTTTYAPRYRAWPPTGYVAPTAEEFAALRRAAQRYASGSVYRSHWERLSDDQVMRRTQLAELDSPVQRGSAATDLYSYTRALRDELRRRGLVFTSLALPQCGSCSRRSERLFEATQKTHPGMVDRSDELVQSAWFCARCWSGDDETEGE